jgi:hypothetical protein
MRADLVVETGRRQQKSLCFLYPEESDVNIGTLFLIVLQNWGKDTILTKISSAESKKRGEGKRKRHQKQVGAPATGELNWHVPFFCPSLQR